MPKKVITTAVLSLYLSACAWFQPHYTSGLEGQSLPEFDLTLKDSTKEFNTSSISAGKPFAILLYQPYCPYCQAQTEDILKNIADFKTMQLYFVTSYSYLAMSRFSDHYHLEKYSNITLVRDSSDQLLRYFNAPGVPYLAIYDQQKKLKKVIIGKNDYTTVKNSMAFQTTGH